MKISCIQMNMEFCQPESNFCKARALIEDAAKNNPDVIVLPEMWNTGFFPKENLRELCDTDGKSVKAEIGALAAEYKVNIVAGSVANLRGREVYNTSYIFDRKGNCVAEYDKTHLFTPMEENVFFESGSDLCKFTLDGISCGIIICYDVRFPELTRSLALEGIDCLFVVAQWPEKRVEHLKTIIRARAIENQIFVACCNSCGKAGETVFAGSSALIDPMGNSVAEAGRTEEIITAECDFSLSDEIRKSINIFSDRRPELYKL